MKRLAIALVTAICLASCISDQKSKTVDEAKKDLTCLEYKPGMEWKEIANAFGPPDVAPPPVPGSKLSSNVRVYRDMVLIFHTERKEVKDGNVPRFVEVVTKVELGREK